MKLDLMQYLSVDTECLVDEMKELEAQAKQHRSNMNEWALAIAGDPRNPSHRRAYFNAQRELDITGIRITAIKHELIRRN